MSRATRARSTGFRVRRPGALMGSLAFAALAAAVILISPDQLMRLSIGNPGAPETPATQPAPPAPRRADGEPGAPLRRQHLEATDPPAPAPAATTPPPAPQPTPIILPPARPAAEPAPPSAPAKPARPPEAAPASTPGDFRVQVGAFDSQAMADAAWRDVAAAWPLETAGKRYERVSADRDRKTVYRALVGGFPDRAEAAAFCARLMAASRACFVK